MTNEFKTSCALAVQNKHVYWTRRKLVPGVWKISRM